jgi:hypothetical protein
VLLAGLAGSLALARRAAREGRHGWALLGLLLVLVAGHWAALAAASYLAVPVIMPRTLVFLQPPLLLLLAAAPWAAPRRWRAPLAIGLVAVTLAGLLGPNRAMTDTRPYRDMVAAVAESDQRHAPVLVVPHGPDAALGYYEARLGADLDLRPFPAPYPVGRDGRPTTAGAVLEAGDLPGLLAGIGDAPTVWAVLRYPDDYDPEGLLAAALRERGYEGRTVVGEGTATLLLRFDRSGPGD